MEIFKYIEEGESINMNKDRLNWGIMGCANIAANAIIPGIKNSSNNSVLYAIAGKRKNKLEEFSKKFNPVKLYDSYEDLINDPIIDVVYIPLPNSLHCEWVVKTAEKKKHILCEKPLGCTPEEVLKMKDACRKNGVILMEAFAYRYNNVIRKAKELVLNGVAGNLKFIESHFTYLTHERENIRLVKSLGGGGCYDIGCYPINFIRYIAGKEPLSIMASGEIDPELRVDMSGCGILNFEKGLKGIFRYSFDIPYTTGFKITGDKGTIEFSGYWYSSGDMELKVIKAENRITKGENIESIILDCPDSYTLQVEQFANCILKGEEPLISLDDTYNNILAIKNVLEQLNY